MVEGRPQVAESDPSKDHSTPSVPGAFGICCFVIALGVGFFAARPRPVAPRPMPIPASQERMAVELRGDEPELGPSDALVTIVEFADYECPMCAAAAAPLAEVLGEHEADVRLVFKHYPLPNHGRAIPAAWAAWAAHQQGRFWEVHSRLLAAQGELGWLGDQADALGLDWLRFSEDMTSEDAFSAVDADRFTGSRLGIAATPTFFVNGRPYVGVQSAPAWRQILAAELQSARAGATPPGATPRG